MITIKFLNEKGNVIPAVREQVREQVIEYISSNTNFKMGPNGFYMEIAQDESETPIYATLNLAITVQNPTVKKNKTVKEDSNSSIQIPKLF